MNTQDAVEILDRLPDHLINTNKATRPEKPYLQCFWSPVFRRLIWVKVVP